MNNYVSYPDRVLFTTIQAANATCRKLYRASGTCDQKCKSDTKCKTCGNYEAWASGSNYRNK